VELALTLISKLMLKTASSMLMTVRMAAMLIGVDAQA
jgi:hypothetical protein